MVGWFVEDENVGAGKQQARKCNTHSPAAAQLPHRALGVGFFEAEASEDLVGIGLERVAPHRLKSALDFAVVGQDRVVVDPGRWVGELGFEAVEVLGKRGHVASPSEDFFDDAPGSCVDKVLGQVAECHVAGSGDRPSIGFGVADQDLDEGGLPGAVAADKRDAATGGELESDVGEEVARPVRTSDAGGGQHDRVRLLVRADGGLPD